MSKISKSIVISEFLWLLFFAVVFLKFDYTRTTLAVVNAIVWLCIVLVFSIIIKYPLSLFNDGIVVLLTWIIPIAITSYYPTLLFLGDYSIIGYSASTSAFFRVRTNSVS